VGLLRTKITPPTPYPGALERGSLVERIERSAVPGRVTLVVAGAGWGKTTLVALWRRATAARRFAWFSVDEADNDPRRFWAYALAALEPLDAGLATRSSELLSMPGTETADVLTALLNELSDVSSPLTLVLDDYQLIVEEEVQRGMRMLVEQLPATVRLVLCTRTTPALPVAGLRGKGKLVEITSGDLGLSVGEARRLLQHETGAERPPDEVDLLFDRTEGWAAGLHLAALSLRGGATAGDLPSGTSGTAGTSGTERMIGDYLRAEVLDRLPERLRRFLRRSSVLDRLSASLCDHTMGRDDSVGVLDRLEHDQLFLVPLDNRREWYRYHHLFLEVLRQDLARSEAGVTPGLHRRAAEWYAGRAMPVDAVHHALAGGDREHAALLTAAHGVSVCLQGRAATVLGWFDALDAIGEQPFRADVRLAAAHALVAGAGTDVASMNRWSDAAEAAARSLTPQGREADALHARVAIARWGATYFAGDAGSALRHADRAVRLQPDDRSPEYAMALARAGWSRFRAARFAEASDALVRAGELAERHGDGLTAMVAAGIRAIIAAAEDRGVDARRLADRAEALGRGQRAGEEPREWCHHFARGWLALRHRHHARAGEHFLRALALVRRGPLALETIETLTAVAIARGECGDAETATELLGEARGLLDRCPDPGHLLADPRLVRLAPNGGERARTLTGREVDVLVLVADGLSNRDIGLRLSVSPRTVEAHLRSAYRKIGVKSRSAATRYAIAHQLARPAP
jgi:LuxR family maltose regulon positive regulatory protein